MMIFIPTIGRREQKTAEALNEAEMIFEFVKPSDCHEKGIRATRQWILERCPANRLVMLDDDLTFFTRSKDGKKFRKSTPLELRKMFIYIEKYLDTYAHVGILERFMGQEAPRGTKANGKYLHLLAYNRALWPKPHPKFETEVAEDIQMNLSLLTAGKPNLILTEWAAENVPYAEGGCNTWRTYKVEYEGTKKLAEMFPGLVTFSIQEEKVMRKHWNEPAKMNIKSRVNWKKAIALGLSQHPMRFPRLK